MGAGTEVAQASPPLARKENIQGSGQTPLGIFLHSNKLDRHTFVSKLISEFHDGPSQFLGILSWYKHTDICVLNLTYAEHQELDVHQIIQTYGQKKSGNYFQNMYSN